MTIVYIIVALLIFGLLILIHELGHFIVARRCGVAIEEFSIGMGPKIVRRRMKKSGTTFSLGAFPIGGYVSMKGENEDEDAPDSFSSKKVWQRMLIVVAGAAMNLILGFVIVFVIVCMSHDLMASTTIAQFNEGATSCAEGGLEVGDTVLKVGKVSVHTGEELTYEIMSQGHEPLTLTVRRGDKKIVLENVIFPQFEEQGSVFGDYDFKVYAIEDPGLGQLLRAAWYRSVSLVKMVWDSLINLISGRYSVESVASPIGVTAAVKDTISQSNMTGWQILQYVLNITAVISINLGVFNLIPFPALDGGRFLFLCIEAVLRRPISRELEGRIHFIGIILLFMLMILVLGKDILMLILP